jgi:hypothetical protein
MIHAPRCARFCCPVRLEDGEDSVQAVAFSCSRLSMLPISTHMSALFFCSGLNLIGGNRLVLFDPGKSGSSLSEETCKYCFD